MLHISRSCYLSTLAALVPMAALSAQTTIWGGSVGGTWTAAKSPYLIKGHIDANGLTIQAGVSVQVDAGVRIRVATWLKALGTAAKPIVFTASGTGLWGGIHEANLAANLTKSIYQHCVIEKAAGGFAITNSLPTISDCTVRNCSRLGGSDPNGGGIRVNNNTGTLVLLRCTIRNCRALYHGGGIYAATTATGAISLQHCVIESNYTNTNSANVRTSIGGGAYLNGSSDLSNCRIANNSCYARHNALSYKATTWAIGGGIALVGDFNMRQTTVVGNTAHARSITNWSRNVLVAYVYGAGVYYDGKTSGKGRMEGCIVARNRALSYTFGGGHGSNNYTGGIYIGAGSCELINCTVTRNTTNRSGSLSFGIFSGLKSTVLRSCIVYNNTGSELSSTSPVVNYSCVEGGYTGTGNITSPPGFLGPTNETISRGSDCVDKGDPAAAADDRRLITTTPFGPGAGTKRNDMGAHGGPTNDQWVQPARLRFDLTPNPATVNKLTKFEVAVTGGNPRFPMMWVWHSPSGLVPLLVSSFGSDRDWGLTINHAPTVVETLRFQAYSLNDRGVPVGSNLLDLKIK